MSMLQTTIFSCFSNLSNFSVPYSIITDLKYLNLFIIQILIAKQIEFLRSKN